MTRIRNKLLVSFVFVALIPLIALGVYGVMSITGSLKESSISKLDGKVSLVSSQIQNLLHDIANDLFYLAGSATMEELINTPPQAGQRFDSVRRRLENDFLAFSTNKKLYLQIRYLDDNGMEVVRVDRPATTSRVIPREKLQNKKSRYYFADTAKLAAGELMISPLDLNREHGRIERPLRPVIRYATPLYNKEGQFRGIVILNVNARMFLEFVRRANTEEEMITFIDPDGFFYFHPSPGKAWGGANNLDSGASFRADYPGIADQIIASRGQTLVSQADHIIAASPVFLDQQQTRLLGNVVDVIPSRIVFSSVVKFRNIFLLIAGTVFLVTIGVAVYLANSITTPLVYLTEMTHAMSKGKLSETISVDTKDEIRLLAESIERLRRSMTILMKRRR